MEKEIRRGYVLWEDENGRHKEPLFMFPDLMESADDHQKEQAERLRELVHKEEDEEQPKVEHEETYDGLIEDDE